MTIEELSKEELEELAQNYLIGLHDSGELEEIYDLKSVPINPEECLNILGKDFLENQYEGTIFYKEDFFCNEDHSQI